MEIGQEIYYTGDMANCSGFGKIVQLHENVRFGNQFSIHMDDGREITIPTHMIKDEYHGNGSIRFCTIEAYREWRKASIENLTRRINSK